MIEKKVTDLSVEEFEKLIKEAKTEFLLSKAGSKIKYVRKKPLRRM